MLAGPGEKPSTRPSEIEKSSRSLTLRGLFANHYQLNKMPEPFGQTGAAGAAGALDDSMDILQIARKLSKFKKRSRQTSRDHHIPMISSVSRTPRVMLLGDSLLERMTTTGQSHSLHPWPSEQMLSQMQLNRINSSRGLAMQKIIHRTSAVFNAGCGGDKIENILYRLLGDEENSFTTEGLSDEAHGQLFHGLFDTLAKRKTQVKLWVVHAGTNNLHEKKGLTDASVYAMRVLLRTLFRISAPETHVLVTALFYRKDIRNELIDQANARLKTLAEELALEMSYVPAKCMLNAEDIAKDNEHQKSFEIIRSESGILDPKDLPSLKIDSCDFAYEARDRSPPTAGQQEDTEETKTYNREDRRDSAVSEVPSGSEKSQYDKSQPEDAVDDAADGTSSDSDSFQAQYKSTNYRDLKAREDAKLSKLQASISRRDFQPEYKGPPKRLGHFDKQRQRNKYLHLQIPHHLDVPRIQFLPVPADFLPEQHLEDHVHLNLGGYQMWMQTLFPVAADVLDCADDMRYAIEQDDARKKLGEFTKFSKFGSDLNNKRLEKTGRFA